MAKVGELHLGRYSRAISVKHPDLFSCQLLSPLVDPSANHEPE